MSAISEIIDRFDQAAKNWGWQEDQGTSDSEMLKSYDEYLAAKHALAESIALLPGEPVAEIVSRFGDPEAFGERELIARQDIQRFPYGTKLYTSPTPHLSVDREALLEEAREALKPFFASDWVDDSGWTELACQNDRIVDWFGPSDFRAVVLILSELEGSPNAK